MRHGQQTPFLGLGDAITYMYNVDMCFFCLVIYVLCLLLCVCVFIHIVFYDAPCDDQMTCLVAS